MNVIARLECELAYYDSAAHRFNHYTTRRTPPRLFLVCICIRIVYNTHTHTHTHIYIYIYIYKSYIQELSQKAVLLPVKSLSNDNPGFRHGFGAEASLPLTQGVPTVSHNTNRLYWTCTNAISVQMQLQSGLGSFLYIPFYLLVKVRVWLKM